MDRADRVSLLGLSFDGVSMQGAVDRCLEWCREPRAPHVVVTANAAILCVMNRDPELRKACLNGDLVVADGMSVLWTSRLAGVGLPERVAGVDLMAHLLAAGSEHRLSAYFLGARKEVVSRLVERCAQDFPGLTVAGFRDGYFPGEEMDAVVDEIRALAPDMLFVGMPSPFKEAWCERHRERLGVPVIMGVGGSFDVLAGYVRRAPTWVQSAGMEWFWRLAMEPRKMWKRYLRTNSEFLLLAAREIARHRLGRERAQPRPDAPALESSRPAPRSPSGRGE